MRTAAVAAALGAWFPAPARACAVCFGKNDNPGLVSGLTWGIVILAGAAFLSLGAIVAAVVRMEKRKAEAEQAA